MNRNSAKTIIPLIIKSISKEPKSIYTISNKINVNWETVRLYLESLKKAGLLNESKKGKRRMFGISKDRESIINQADFIKELKIIALCYVMYPKVDNHIASKITKISEEKVVNYKRCLEEINFFEYLEMQKTFYNIKKFGASIFDDIKKK